MIFAAAFANLAFAVVAVIAAVKLTRWWRAARRERWDVLVGAVGLLALATIALLAGNVVVMRDPLLFRVPPSLAYVAPVCALIIALRTLARRAEMSRAALRLRLLVLAPLAIGSIGGWCALHARDDLHTWALAILLQPRDQVCAPREGGDIADERTPCWIHQVPQPWLLWPLMPTHVSMERTGDGVRYIDLDWGGGHLDARGLLLGPPGFRPDSHEGAHYHEVDDGVLVYTFDSE